MSKRDEQRAHDFLDAFEAEITERSRGELGEAVAGLPVTAAILWPRSRLGAVLGCLLVRHPEAAEHEGLMARILVHLVPFVDRRVWDSDEGLARLVVAVYRAAKECTL